MVLFDWISLSTGVELIPELNLFWCVTSSVGLQPGALRSFACQHDYIFSSWEFFPCHHSKYITTFVCRSCASTKIPQDPSTRFPTIPTFVWWWRDAIWSSSVMDDVVYVQQTSVCGMRERKRWFVQVYGCHSSVYPGSVLCLERGLWRRLNVPCGLKNTLEHQAKEESKNREA